MVKALVLISSFLFAPAAFAAANDNWSIDPAHSSANFSVRHMMISDVKGSFGKLEGTVTYDGKDLVGAKVNATIDATTVDTRNSQRDEHLKSADFLDTAKYPKITFVSKSVSKTSRGFDLNGDLTLHGVTKPVILHAQKLSDAVKDPYGKMRVGTIATTSIDRQEFGVSFNQKIDKGGAMVGDQVNIELDIEFVQ
jgi:polyisoprenoid-binding protein YceI